MVEEGPTRGPVHQPEAQAHRGLRLGPVRLSRGGHHRWTTAAPPFRHVADAFGGSFDDLSPAQPIEPVGPGFPPSHHVRGAYDREIAEVKDNVLRMGSMVEAQIRAAIAALVAHDAEAALQVILDDRQINEVQRKATAMIAAVIATQNPVARDLRYLLTLDHVSYELERMGDHAGSVAKQARKLAPYPPLKDYVLLPAARGRASRSSSAGSSARWWTSTRTRRARSPRLDDEVDDLYHRDLRPGAAC